MVLVDYNTQYITTYRDFNIIHKMHIEVAIIKVNFLSKLHT